MLHVQDLIEDILNTEVPDERKLALTPLVKYIRESQKEDGLTQLNFICTHNSRRSQFSQVWAHVAANHFGIKTNSHSGGVEITACNERTVASLKRIGLVISSIKNDGANSDNPRYEITFKTGVAPILLFSKLFNAPSSPSKSFATIMNCAHADENCPVIPGAENRISVRYEDPKKYDDTRLEEIMYDERSLQIASEMIYAFGEV